MSRLWPTRWMGTPRTTYIGFTTLVFIIDYLTVSFKEFSFLRTTRLPIIPMRNVIGATSREMRKKLPCRISKNRWRLEKAIPRA